jgi:hypothetical protein
VKEVFISLEKAAKKMGLQVNQEKAKYMPVTKKDCAHISSRIEIGSYQFETVHSFIYPGSEVNCKNDVSAEIKKKVFSLQIDVLTDVRNHFKSQLKSRKTKMTLCR